MELLSSAMQLRMIRHVRAFLFCRATTMATMMKPVWRKLQSLNQQCTTAFLKLTKMSDMPVTLVMGKIGQNYNKEKSKSEIINVS